MSVIINFMKRFFKTGGQNASQNAEYSTDKIHEAYHKIVYDYAKYIEKNPNYPSAVVDATRLPYQKDVILDSLKYCLLVETDNDRANGLIDLATYLAEYQDNVGKETLHLSGYSPEEMTNIIVKESDLHAKAKLIAKITRESEKKRELYETNFRPLVERDIQIISSEITETLKKRAEIWEKHFALRQSKSE